MLVTVISDAHKFLLRLVPPHAQSHLEQEIETLHIEFKEPESLWQALDAPVRWPKDVTIYGGALYREEKLCPQAVNTLRRFLRSLKNVVHVTLVDWTQELPIKSILGSFYTPEHMAYMNALPIISIQLIYETSQYFYIEYIGLLEILQVSWSPVLVELDFRVTKSQRKDRQLSATPAGGLVLDLEAEDVADEVEVILMTVRDMIHHMPKIKKLARLRCQVPIEYFEVNSGELTDVVTLLFRNLVYQRELRELYISSSPDIRAVLFQYLPPSLNRLIFYISRKIVLPSAQESLIRMIEVNNYIDTKVSLSTFSNLKFQVLPQDST